MNKRVFGDISTAVVQAFTFFFPGFLFHADDSPERGYVGNVGFCGQIVSEYLDAYMIPRFSFSSFVLMAARNAGTGYGLHRWPRFVGTNNRYHLSTNILKFKV